MTGARGRAPDRRSGPNAARAASESIATDRANVPGGPTVGEQLRPPSRQLVVCWTCSSWGVARRNAVAAEFGTCARLCPERVA